MNKALLFYINLIKQIIDRDYGKEAVFYDDGEWYSRKHCRIISLEELAEWALEVSDREGYFNFLMNEMQ